MVVVPTPLATRKSLKSLLFCKGCWPENLRSFVDFSLLEFLKNCRTCNGKPTNNLSKHYLGKIFENQKILDDL